MVDLDLAAIRARAEAATGRRWSSELRDVIVEDGPNGPFGLVSDAFTRADAEHIAGMDPETTLALVEQIEEHSVWREHVISAIKVLHGPYDVPGPGDGTTVSYCITDGFTYPCATLRTIDGQESGATARDTPGEAPDTTRA